MALFGSYTGLDYKQEDMITKAQFAIAEQAIKDGRDVIVDDMNLRPKYLTAWYNFATAHSVTFCLREFDTSLETCIVRDGMRMMAGERGVGEKVIRDIARRSLNKDGSFLAWTPPKTEAASRVEEIPGLPRCVIVDIDGTMTTGPNNRGPFEWAKVGQDEPRKTVVDLVNWLLRDGRTIKFLSGRDEICRTETMLWLQQHIDYEYDRQWDLAMRAYRDQRKDSVVKTELFDEHIRGKYNVDFVIDDRDQVVKMWREMGLTCLQVDYGNF